MPMIDECSKTREELIEELHRLRREVALLKSTRPSPSDSSDQQPDWPISLIDQMDQMVILLDSQGQVLEANQVALDHFGLERKEILNTALWSLKCWQISREVNKKLRRAIRSVVSGEVVCYETEIAKGSKNECPTSLDLSLKPLRDPTGTVVSVLVEGRDITERKKVQREVERKTEEHRALYEQLKQFDQLKTRFFANVSHELRTPLALILGPVRKQLECVTKESDLRKALHVIERNAGLLLQRVNNLMDLSKLEANEMQAQYARVDLAKLARLAASHFEIVAEERDLTFHVETPETLPAEVDCEKLQRILLNLLSNAFKFTPNGGAIGLNLCAEKQNAVFTIQDSGSGVVPQQRKTIFERFRQGDCSANHHLAGPVL
ncbi:MAG: PAS domain-containing sensor histidine kinase, partial [Planctomycetaceae bacterium]|nr:PAS domain-containing sensor histidine kinase [Planctomycetaceae bacterium]